MVAPAVYKAIPINVPVVRTVIAIYQSWVNALVLGWAMHMGLIKDANHAIYSIATRSLRAPASNVGRISVLWMAGAHVIKQVT